MSPREFDPNNPTPQNVAQKHAELVSGYGNAVSKLAEIDNYVGEELYNKVDDEVKNLEFALGVLQERQSDGSVDLLSNLLSLSDDRIRTYVTYFAERSLLQKFVEDHPDIINTLKRFPFIEQDSNLTYEDYAKESVNIRGANHFKKISDNSQTISIGDMILDKANTGVLAVKFDYAHGEAGLSVSDIIETHNSRTHEDALLTDDAKILDDLIGKMISRREPEAADTELDLSDDEVRLINGINPGFYQNLDEFLRHELGTARRARTVIGKGRARKLDERHDEISQAQRDEAYTLVAARRHAERYMGELQAAALAEAALDGVQINRDDAIKLKK